MARDLTQTGLDSRELARGGAITVTRDRVRLPTGRTTERMVVRHPGAVVILPLLPDGRIILVRQYRYAIGSDLWELPAGTLEPGEDPATTARRELQEEAGYRPGRLTELGAFYSAPGFCSERLWAYLAADLTPARLAGDDDEEIECVALTLAEVMAWAAAGKLQDAKTLATLFLFNQHQAAAG